MLHCKGESSLKKCPSCNIYPPSEVLRIPTSKILILLWWNWRDSKFGEIEGNLHCTPFGKGFDGFCKFYTMVLPCFLASNRFPKGLHRSGLPLFALHQPRYHRTIATQRCASGPVRPLRGPWRLGWFQDPEWVSCKGGDSEFKHV